MHTTKVCVVTGSSSGIGAATALLFAGKGWNVVINYSRSAETATYQCAVRRPGYHGGGPFLPSSNGQ